MSTTIIPGPNVFRAISGSLFSTAANWSRGFVPTGSDVAMIGDNCVIDITRTVGSLIVRPGFTASVSGGLTLQVNDVINVMGHLSCSGNPTINSYAKKNIINSLSPGISTFTYTGSYRQSIPGANYYNINVLGRSNKNTTGNLSVSGSMVVNQFANLDLGVYNLNVSGSLTSGFASSGDGKLTKSQTGSIIVNGLLNLDIHTTLSCINLSGNPSVELKGGLYLFNPLDASGLSDYSGLGNWVFSTNNQLVSEYAGRFIFSGPTTVLGAITITLRGSQTFNNTINGTEAGSTLVNEGSVYIGYPATPMTTGSFIYTVPNTTLGFVMNTNGYNLPYTNYQNLYISGRGPKVISGNTYVSGTLRTEGASLANQSILELSSSNFTVSGSSTIIYNSSLRKSSPVGSTIFIGDANFDTGATPGYYILDFSTSHANIEFRNGFRTYITAGNFLTGTGSFIFSTNNQSIRSDSQATTFDSKLIVSGNIAVTMSNGAIYLNNIVNGTDPGSIFANRGTMYFISMSSLSGSMTTGSLDVSYPGNTIGLVGNYTATTPSQLNTFYNLYVFGTGVKTLGTSSYISGSLTFGNPAILELSSSNLFVSGTTSISNGMVLTKSGSGTTVFNGSANLGDFGRIDFRSSNSSIEFRNGFGASYEGYCYLGSGSAIFSTNNQTYNGGIVTTGPMIISGSIRLKNLSLVLYNTINGTSPLSVLDNSGSIDFYTASAVDFSMTTGSFISASYPGSSLGFYFTGSYKLPMSSFRNLNIGVNTVNSPGYKTFNSNVVINDGLRIIRDSIDTENNNLSILGTTYLQYAGAIKKSGSGSILLSGSLNMGDFGTIDFISASNASLEMRGGLIGASYGTAMLMGSSSLTCSVNSQNIVSCNFSNNYASILISGSITVGFGFLYAGSFTIAGTLNGTDANSRAYFSASSTALYYGTQQPMQTGILDVSSSAVTFVYSSGSQNVKGGVYRNLTFLNGLKTLQGNVSVLGTFSTGSGATSGSYNLNGFTLTNP